MTLDKGFSDGGPAETEVSKIAFRLDPGSGVPTYLQLVQQVEQALLLGYLTTGDQLPKVRDVVTDLAINPNTVLKAYRELEHKGLANGRPGQGTFVQAVGTPAGLSELTGLRRRLLRWLTEADDAGLDDAGVVALFTTTLRDFAERRRDEDAGAPRAHSRRSGGGAA
jgi:GntR family transcriptional regulator